MSIYGCYPKAYHGFDSIQYTDKHIVEFNNRLSNMMRRDMNWNAIIRYASSVLVIGAAASAGALGIAGASADSIGFTALGGGFIAELQGVFGARDKARAFQQGVELMEEASARYVTALSNDPKNGGIASNNRLTNPGAKLFEESIASLKLVEKILIAEIPTIEEVSKAAGKYNQFNIFPENIKYEDFALNKEKTKRTLVVKAIKGGPIVEFSSPSPSIVSIESKKDNRNAIVLTLHGDSANWKKEISIIVINAQQKTARVNISPEEKGAAAKAKTSNTDSPQLDGLLEDLNKKKKIITTAESVLNGLKKPNFNAKGSIVLYKEEIDTAKAKLKKSEADYDADRKNNKLTGTQVRDLADEIKSTKEKIAKLEKDLKSLNENLDIHEKTAFEVDELNMKIGNLLLVTLDHVKVKVDEHAKESVSQLPTAPFTPSK
jgi:hypothetical protein